MTGAHFPPSEPRNQLGIYWGYRVRVARGIYRALKDGPFKVRSADRHLGDVGCQLLDLPLAKGRE